MTGELARELATTHALNQLPGGAWRLMQDLRCTQRRLANLDHIVVGRGGVFVIDSRKWMGQLELRSGVLLQDGSRRESTVARTAESAVAVAEMVPGIDPDLVVPVLCFDREEPISGWAREVLVYTTGNIVELLTSQKRVLALEEVDQLFERLTWSLPSTMYSIGAPSGEARSGHRLEGRARTRVVPRKRSSAKHVPGTGGQQFSPAIRGALIAIACCLVLISLVRWLALPAATWAITMVASLF